MSETMDEFRAKRALEAKRRIAEAITGLSGLDPITAEQITDADLEVFSDFMKGMHVLCEEALAGKRLKDAEADFMGTIFGGRLGRVAK